MENGHEAPPIVVNGVMFVATPGNQVLAINAKTGTLLWRYRRPACRRPSCCCIRPAEAWRSTATRCIFAAGEAVLVALDAQNRRGNLDGRQWPITRAAYYMSLAPLVADGKVLVGTSGGEVGIRGFVAAYDAETGKELWKTYMVPAPGEPGSETWQRRGMEDRRRVGRG